MPRKTPGPPCGICNEPSVAKNLCEKHYRSWHIYGDPLKGRRPDDWGKRSNHPLYETWSWTKRVPQGRDARWNDLDTFLRDIGPKPSDKHRLRRLNKKQPWGPENFHWAETLQGRVYRLDTADGKKEYQRVWRKANPLRSKNNDLKKSYGITLSDYHEMFERQNGVCAICLNAESVHPKLCVDHCHGSKKVRGLLCTQCNRALGMLKDDPVRLQRAINYLKEASTSE